MAAHANEPILHRSDPLLACTQHRPLISDDKLRELYLVMLRVRKLRKPRSGIRNQKQNWRFNEALVVSCTIDLRAEDTLISSADLPNSTVAQRSVLNADSVAALATGVALLHRVQAKGNLVVTFADAKHIARNPKFLRIAHLESLPIIYVQFEKSLPRTSRAQTHIPSIAVDKADVVAIYRVASEAIDKARRGAGPTLIQCVPFSLQQRATVDHHSQDPIRYMEYYLRKRNLWSEDLNDGDDR